MPPSKRTSAPPPMEIPPASRTQSVPPHISPQSIPPTTTTSMFASGPWCPPYPQQSMAPSSTPCWFPGVQYPGMASSSAQGPWWAPPPSASSEDSELQVWGMDSIPPGGMFNFLAKNTPRHGPAQPMGTDNSSQLISVGGDTNESDCPRTGKRLLFTKEEDIALVGAWLNNSNDPIHSNYKKNEQYWKEVTAAYNRAIPKNRARLLKQVKDRFGRIKKRVQWFCGSWKEANALWASGESDADLMNKALNLYEEEHKKDGPFQFRHCWEVLRKAPKWDAYLERLAKLDPEKRKYNVDDDVDQHFSVQDEEEEEEERPIGGKKAKELQKKSKKQRKGEACFIDLEDELQAFIETQNKANEGRKEMLEIQQRVSSENLEARKLAYLAAKENKESAMIETYRELLKQDTTVMAEDVRSEHVLALRCLREKLFSNTN